jgi:hypothetical protein
MLSIIWFIVLSLLINFSFYLGYYIKFSANILYINWYPYTETWIYLSLIYFFGFLVYKFIFFNDNKEYKLKNLIFKALKPLVFSTIIFINFLYIFRESYKKFPSSVILIASIILLFIYTLSLYIQQKYSFKVEQK